MVSLVTLFWVGVVALLWVGLVAAIWALVSAGSEYPQEVPQTPTND
ncbi:hypothetical protein M0R89_09090 [Halorussus limi]|uniref:Uncharacterized protein n=1 Tax=Halorussus limi TaxID=2938695 RepID=A0A8U0HYQ7_9EURY|nr:hypothetical protein [Halorussus limi]UPV76190.1 hypothetical protein M0R89_09090 [Halorussus limi]